MSVSDVALVVGVAAVGVAAGSLGVYFNARRGRTPAQAKSAAVDRSVTEESVESTEPLNSKLDAALKGKSASERLIPKDQLEKSKRELRTLLLEKELVSAALTRLYEAEAAKEITREEREILGLKYREELKSLDERIVKIDAFIEVGDLETLRDQLIRLVSQKIDAIEKRIEHTKMVAEPLIADYLKQTAPKLAVEQPKPEPAQAKPRVPDISDLLKEEEPPPLMPIAQAPESVTEPSGVEQPITVPVSTSSVDRLRDRKRTGESDSKVEELQKELLEALDRLEKLDVES